MHFPSEFVTIDFETQSDLDITKVGAYRYAEHESTKIICMSWKYIRPGGGSEAATIDWRGDQQLCGAFQLASDGLPLVAHNAAFEREIIRHKAPWLLDVDAAQWLDTMESAAALALPLKLERLGDVLGLGSTGKMKGGRARLTAYYKKPTEENYLRVAEYCEQDVEATAEIAQRLGFVDGFELEVIALDRGANTLGVRLDVAAARGAQKLVTAALERANARLGELTGGITVTKVKQLTEWLRANGVPDLPGLGAEVVDSYLGNPGLPKEAREVLSIRQIAGKSSVKKLLAMVAMVCADGRLKGNLQYCGASRTGRWAGRGVQPQNMPRPGEYVDPSIFYPALDLETFEAMHGDVFMAVANSLRGMLTASEGHDIVRADLSAIEARVLFALVGHLDALEVMARGDCIYCEMATSIYAYPVIKGQHHVERQLGKALVLGCGYGMGGRTFHTNAATGELSDMTTAEAADYVRGYRTRFYKVPQGWKSSEAAFRNAILAPGNEFGAVHCTFLATLDPGTGLPVLRITLPSGRKLHYWNAEVDLEGDLSYMGLDTNKNWVSIHTYGGKIIENITQAVARDIMVWQLVEISRSRDFQLLLSVHDELVSEAPAGSMPVAELEAAMSIAPPWLPKIPLAAEGEIGYKGVNWRYGK